MCDELICLSICEKAKDDLQKFFQDLQTRAITPSQLEDLQNAGELHNTLQIVNKFLSLKLFSDQHMHAIENLKQELTTYQLFTERNRKLQHFAHTFSDFSEGNYVLIRLYNLLCNDRGGSSNKTEIGK